MTGLFKPQALLAAITEGTRGGFRLLRREFTIEPRRLLFIFTAPSFGMVFQRDDKNPEPEQEWALSTYKTRLLTRTADVKAMNAAINKGASGGYELFFALKYPCRFLLFFPRECYFFLFRKAVGESGHRFQYSVEQMPYRFFTKTINELGYQQQLNDEGSDSQLKITFRDERRLLGLFKQPTALSIWERAG